MKAYQNLQVTGSIGVSGSVTAVYVFSTSSFASTASYISPGATASYAKTASYVSGSEAILQNLTVAGTASIKYLNVEFESSSVIFSSGSNQFGDAFDDKHSFTGSVGITGSLTMDSASVASLGNITGSLAGTFSGSAVGTFTGSFTGSMSGSLTGSFEGVSTGSFSGKSSGSFTGSFSGSYSGSGHQLFDISASSIIGLNLARISTGSITASVDVASGFVVKSLDSGSTFSGSINLISGSIYVTTGETGSSIFATSSWAMNVVGGASSAAATVISGSEPTASSVSGTLWFNNVNGNLYVQAASPTGSSWLPTSLTMVTGSVTASVHHTNGFVVNSIASGSTFSGSIKTISGSILVHSASVIVTSGSIRVSNSYTGSNIFGTASNAHSASYAEFTSQAPVVVSESSPNVRNSGSLWWNTNDGNLYIQATSLSGSTWVPAVTSVATGEYGATLTTQHTTASTTWTVNHSLNTLTPIVQVYTGSQVLIPASITSTNANTTTITFATATVGTSVVSTGVGGPTSASFALTAASAVSASYLDGSQATYISTTKNSNQQTITANSYQRLTVWDAAATSVNAAEWNPTTGLFTATKAGVYSVTAQIQFALAAYNISDTVAVQINKNSTAVSTGFAITPVSASIFPASPATTAVVSLAIGDTISVFAYSQRTNLTFTSANNLTIAELPARITR